VNFLIANSRRWRSHMAEDLGRRTGGVITISTPEQITQNRLAALAVTRALLPLWSRRIPAAVNKRSPDAHVLTECYLTQLTYH
jgi:hypothetical protein